MFKEGKKALYCQVPDVKPTINIKLEDTTYDTEISECITSADGLIVAIAAGRGLTIPSVIPQTLKDASRYIAGSLFRSPRSPPIDKPVLLDIGMRFLNAWMDTFQVGKML